MKLSVINSVAKSAPSRRFVEWMNKPIKSTVQSGAVGVVGKTRYDIAQVHVPVLVGLWITGCQAYAIYKSKNMPKERKNPLLFNILVGNALATAGIYTLTAFLNGTKNKFVNRFLKGLLKSKPFLCYENSSLKSLLVK